MIARSAEAKSLGIQMGVPYFQVKHWADKGKLVVFSSNYELYGDLSKRMMQAIATVVSQIEIYSIDECFADVSGIETAQLNRLGQQIRQWVWQWVGIPSSVGIAPTKTLAKFCNHLAKAYPRHFDGVVVWTDWPVRIRQRALHSQQVSAVWGVGRKTGKQLERMGIHTAFDLVCTDSGSLRKRFGVMLERTQRELQGMQCFELEAPQPKQHILHSRSFGELVDNSDGLKAAIAYHARKGAQQLRRQNSVAHMLTVFLQANRFRYQDEQYYGYQTACLPYACADALVINTLAQQLLDKLYRPGYLYKKCGIELGGIEPGNQVAQADFWPPGDSDRTRSLMTTLDLSHERFGRGTIKLGSEYLSDCWHMRQRI